MIINAEFHRNLWLEINFTRLITVPLLLALVFWAFFVSQDSPNVKIEEMGSFLSGVALSMFALITVLWGAQLASNSITDEAQAQTWDWQRLSAQSPTALVFGKLFGGTILAWYGGLCCVVAYTIFSRSTLDGFRLSWVVLAVSGAIFSQAMAILLALATPPEHRAAHQQKRNMSMVRLGMILLGIYAMGMATVIWTKDNVSGIEWYGYRYDLLPFFMWSAVVWAGWAVFGSIQRVATLLRSPTTPFPWLFFVLFCMGYVMGFTPESTQMIGGQKEVSHYYGQVAYAVGFSLMVGISLLEDKMPLQLRWWFSTLASQDWRKTWRHAWKRVWQRTPRWIATFVLMLLVFPFAMISAAPEFYVFLPVSLLMFTRDMAVLHWFHWTPVPKRPYLAFGIYLLLVYLLLPFLFRRLDWLFYPNPEKSIITVSIFIVETFIAVAFLLQRWELYYSAEYTHNEEEETMQQSLIKDERVIYKARVSLGTQGPLFLTGLGIIILGVVIYIYIPGTFTIFKFNVGNMVLRFFLLGSLLFWGKALFRYYLASRSTKLTFTNKRMIVKLGYPEQQNYELQLGKINTIQVSQTTKGRWFNYGKLVISSLGNQPITLQDIASPNEFRRALLEAQEHK